MVASFAEAWIEIMWYSPGFNNLPSPPSRRRGLKLVIRTTVLVVVTSSLRRDNNYNSLQNNKYIDEKFYKHFMMAVLFDCFAFVY